MPILAPNLATLRAEFNARWPRRDKASDGWIGDPAHQQRPSGHNPDESGNAERQDADRIDEVRGLDLDKDVDPAPADELYAELDRIRRTPALRRRLIYIIYRRKIASASNGWVWKDYSGDNPHTEHGHLSGHPDYDNDTTPWGVAKEAPDMTPEQDARLKRVETALSRLDGREPIGQAYLRLAVGQDDTEGAKQVSHPTLKSLGEQLRTLAERPAVAIDYDKLAEAIVRRAIGVEQA